MLRSERTSLFSGTEIISDIVYLLFYEEIRNDFSPVVPNLDLVQARLDEFSVSNIVLLFCNSFLLVVRPNDLADFEPFSVQPRYPYSPLSSFMTSLLCVGQHELGEIGCAVASVPLPSSGRWGPAKAVLL